MMSAIILAAGTSSRMGRPKPLLEVGGQRLLERVLEAVQHSTAEEIVVVLGATRTGSSRRSPSTA